MATQVTLNSGAVSSAGSLKLQTNGTTDAVTIDTAQNLGLGVTPSAWNTYTVYQVKGASVGSAGAEIQVSANTYYNTGWKYYQSALGATRYEAYNGYHAWYTAASGTAGNPITFTQAMTLDASGRLGIGTTSPTEALTINNAGYPLVTLNDSGTNRGQVGYTFDFGYFHVSSAAALVFRTAGTERARIDSSGNLLVGTTTLGAGGGGNTIISAVSASGQDAVFIKCNTSAAGNLPLGLWNSAGTGDNALLYFYTNSTISYKGGIDYNRTGGLVRYNTSSDATLKNIIGDADGSKSIDILKSTRIREYSWKDDETNKPQIGVIAQELYETYKGAVSVGGDKVIVDADGNETTQYVPWAVDKTAFTFHLIAGWQAHEKIIQEQQTIIQQLTARIETLEAK